MKKSIEVEKISYEVIIRYYYLETLVRCPQIPLFNEIYDTDILLKDILKGIKKRLSCLITNKEIKPPRYKYLIIDKNKTDQF